jgi:germination protein M
MPEQLKKKSVLIAFAALVLIIAGAAVFRGVWDTNADTGGDVRVDLYFLNQATLSLEPETRYIYSEDDTEMTRKVFDMLYGGPLSKKLTRTIPRFDEIIELKLVMRENPGDDFLEIQFPEAYADITPGEEQLLRSSLVWSMTELDFIKDVKIYIGSEELLKTDGEPMGYQNRTNVIINPLITPEKVDTETVVLYFFDEEKKTLLPEERIIFVNPDQPIEKYIVEQLIAGPRNGGLTASVPAETKIKGDIKTEDGVCYINLSGDFAARNTMGGETPVLSVYAVVNSLTELSDVNKVQILIDGEKIDSFKGALNLSMPLERDDAFVSQYNAS